MLRLHAMLSEERQHGRTAQVNFESRGRKEDRELELEFRRIDANEGGAGWQDFGLFDFRPVFVPKSANSVDLQLADLTARSTARSIARSDLSPGQPNHAFEIVWPKIGGLARLP